MHILTNNGYSNVKCKPNKKYFMNTYENNIFDIELLYQNIHKDTHEYYINVIINE